MDTFRHLFNNSKAIMRVHGVFIVLECWYTERERERRRESGLHVWDSLSDYMDCERTQRQPTKVVIDCLLVSLSETQHSLETLLMAQNDLQFYSSQFIKTLAPVYSS